MKRSGLLGGLALATALFTPTAAVAWSCSSEEPLAAPLSLEERTRVAAEVEAERQAAAERLTSVDQPPPQAGAPARRAPPVVGVGNRGDQSN